MTLSMPFTRVRLFIGAGFTLLLAFGFGEIFAGDFMGEAMDLINIALILCLFAWTIKLLNRLNAGHTDAERRLREREAMSRAVTDGMAEGVITLRPDGEIVEANAAAARIFGYPKEDLLGRDIAELVPERNRESFREMIGQFAAEETFQVAGFETRGARKDGTEFPAKVSFGDVRVGKTRFFTGIVRDMTKRRNMTAALKASEAQLRQITDAVPALIYYADADCRVRFHNRLTREWFGLTDAQVDDRSLADIVGEDAFRAIRPRIDEVLAGYPVRYERTHRMPSGVDKDLAVHYYPRYAEDDSTGKVIGFYGLCTDITELKRIDRMKSEFVSTVSHELRTPLTSIRGSLGLLAGGAAGSLPEAAAPLVQIAKSNCERLIRLINDILDTEKIESGKMRFDLQVADVKPMLEQALSANEGFAAQHQVDFVLSAPVARVRANVDADRFAQVMTNLLSNAVKFSPAGSAVKVVLTRADGRIRIEVRDQGPGIPEEFRHRIFQKFSQADSSDARQKGGTGLGLNISKAIIERLGGTIGFDTETGVGTTFFFELLEAPVEPARVLVCEDSPRTSASRPRILHVEDDPDVQRIAAAIASDLATFDFAPTLREARECLRGGGFDMVLLDIALPDGSGWDLMKEIANIEPHIPVVVFSAAGVDRREPREGRHGAVTVLEKATTSNEKLSETIHKVLNRRLPAAA